MSSERPETPAFERLTHALNDPEVVSIAQTHRIDRPLTLECLKIEAPKLIDRLADDEAQPSIDAVGWPSGTDHPARSGREYASLEEFRHYLTVGNGLFVAPHKALNNFVLSFQAREAYEPGHEHDPVQGWLQMFSSKPAIMRGQLLAPELFSSLRAIHHDTTIRERNELYALNDQVVQGLHLAYNLCSRLVAVDDEDRHLSMMLQGKAAHPTSRAKPFDDAHVALAQ